MASFPRMAHIYTFSKIFTMIFRLSTNLIHVSGFFWEGVKMRPMFIDFLCEIHPFGWLIPAVLLQPSPGPSCRGTQIILISSIYGMHRYENFARKL